MSLCVMVLYMGGLSVVIYKTAFYMLGLRVVIYQTALYIGDLSADVVISVWLECRYISNGVICVA